MSSSSSPLTLPLKTRINDAYTRKYNSLRRIKEGAPTLVYVRVWGNVIMLENLYTGESLQVEPYCAFQVEEDESRTVVATGVDAKKMEPNDNLFVVNPFGHDRIALADPQLNSAVISEAIKQLIPSAYIRQNTVAIIHLKDRLDGGISKVEKGVAGKLALDVKANLPYTGDDLALEQAQTYTTTHLPPPDPITLPVVLLNTGVILAITLVGLLLLGL